VDLKKRVMFPNLAAEMARKGIKQKELAVILGISNPTICKKMSGQTDWSLTEIETLCSYFGKSYKNLFKR